MANSDSSDYERLRQFLSERRVSFVREIRASRTSPVDFVLFVSADTISERASKSHTSWRQLKRLQQNIHQSLNISVEWIVLSGTQATTLETAFLELLQKRYPGAVTAVFVSSPTITPIWAWLETNGEGKELPDLKQLTSIARDLFALFQLPAPEIAYTNAAELPTNLAILRSLKIYAPVSVQALADALIQRGAVIPQVRWLQTKLDTMRKAGTVLRLEDGEYILTELGLSSVPTSKNRSSSDVERALALGRRKW